MRALFFLFVALTFSAFVTLCIVSYLTRQFRYVAFAVLIGLSCGGPNMVRVACPDLAAHLGGALTWSLSPAGLALRAAVALGLLAISYGWLWRDSNVPSLTPNLQRTSP